MFTEYRPPEFNTPGGWALMLKSDPFYKLKLAFDPRLKIIQRYLKGSLLDAGCGRGEWANFLSYRGYESTGLDYSAEMVEFNRTKFPRCKFEVGKIQHMPFENDTFQSLISWGVIEHDEAGPAAALQEFYRILKIGGRGMITVPIDSRAQREASQNEFGSEGAFFQYFFTQKELADEMNAVGFKIIDSGFCSRPHPNLIWPNKYVNAGKVQKRALQALASIKDQTYGNMIHVIVEKNS